MSFRGLNFTVQALGQLYPLPKWCTLPPQTGLDSAIALILQITRWTASQATVGSPLSPLCGLKPHCRGPDAPEHSDHRAVISCWVGLEEADIMWPLWSTNAEVQTGGNAWRSQVLDRNVYDTGVRAPGNAKQNTVSDNKAHCWPLHLTSVRPFCPCCYFKSAVNFILYKLTYFGSVRCNYDHNIHQPNAKVSSSKMVLG